MNPPKKLHPKPKTILLVDDENSWLEAMIQALEKEPYKILTAGSAEDALSTLSRKRADLILSDVRMPVTNGFDLFEKVRKIPKLKKIPFVFMSSLDDYDARRIAKVLGADDYIEKPFDLDSAKSIIHDLLGRFKMT